MLQHQQGLHGAGSSASGASPGGHPSQKTIQALREDNAALRERVADLELRLAAAEQEKKTKPRDNRQAGRSAPHFVSTDFDSKIKSVVSFLDYHCDLDVIVSIPILDQFVGFPLPFCSDQQPGVTRSTRLAMSRSGSAWGSPFSFRTRVRGRSPRQGL